MKKNYKYSTPWVNIEPRDTRQRRRKSAREGGRGRLFRANPRLDSPSTLNSKPVWLDKQDPRTGPLIAPRPERRKTMLKAARN